jgi:transposase-like protein
LLYRGATQQDLLVTDGDFGLQATICALFPATPWQRCVVHKQCNVINAIPHRERKEVSAELAGIFKQEKKEDALLNLAAFTSAGLHGHHHSVRVPLQTVAALSGKAEDSKAREERSSWTSL